MVFPWKLTHQKTFIFPNIISHIFHAFRIRNPNQNTSLRWESKEKNGNMVRRGVRTSKILLRKWTVRAEATNPHRKSLSGKSPKEERPKRKAGVYKKSMPTVLEILIDDLLNWHSIVWNTEDGFLTFQGIQTRIVLEKLWWTWLWWREKKDTEKHGVSSAPWLSFWSTFKWLLRGCVHWGRKRVIYHRRRPMLDF